MPEAFLRLSAEDRLDALAVAAGQRPDYLLEKDVWVVWALQTVFASPFGDDLAFKGGTSLSKAYNAISRFSEDVDLTYDIRAIAPGFKGSDEPATITPAQARKWSDKIRKDLLPKWVANEMAPWIEAQLAAQGLNAQVEVQETDILLVYEPAAPSPPYVKTHVKLEFGARATGEPCSPMSVTCYAAGALPDLSFPQAMPRVMLAERTFWEKATAMHVFALQGAFRGGDGCSRHWHDLVRLDDAGLAQGAIDDRELARAVADHKTKFFPEKVDGAPIDYLAATSGRLSLVVTGDAYDTLKADYEAMIEAGLLLEDAETFAALMRRCQDLQDRANFAAAT